MKKILVVITIIAICVSVFAQTDKETNLNKRISELEDRIAIKNLTDSFSILADQKDAQMQTLFSRKMQ